MYWTWSIYFIFLEKLSIIDKNGFIEKTKNDIKKIRAKSHDERTRKEITDILTKDINLDQMQQISQDHLGFQAKIINVWQVQIIKYTWKITIINFFTHLTNFSEI